MNRYLNLYLLEYAIGSLLRQKNKNIFIFIILSSLVFLLSSVFFITSSLKYELDLGVESLAEITVQKLKGSRVVDVKVSRVDNILSITGVISATPRVWGYYYFANGGANFSLVGIDEFESDYKSSMKKLVKSQYDDTLVYVGVGVRDVMSKSYYDKYFNFILPDGSLKKITIGGVFDSDTLLESNDVIMMSSDNVREIHGIDKKYATDIVVKVSNIDEIATVASKIKLLYPDSRVITKNDLKVSYQNIFDYKSGLFLALLIVSLFTFFIIVYDRASGLSGGEKREVGILKAIGWSLEDILKWKFYEAFIISISSFLVGNILALSFVYLFNAPILRDIFFGYSGLKPSFELPFVFEYQTIAIAFFLSVPIYIASIIVPSWMAASMDADEVMR